MAAIEDQNKFSDLDLLSSAAEEEKPRRRPRAKRSSNSNDLLWNVLTALVWFGMAAAVAAFVWVYLNPPGGRSPLQAGEPTLVAVIEIPTQTSSPTVTQTPRRGPATRTPTPTRTPVTPTVTLTPSPTPTETPTPGPSPTPTIKSIYPFILRNDPVVLAGSTFPNHETCKLWVAGQTYDLNGTPMVGITVMMGGYLKGRTLYQVSLTGTALQYGQAGYEFVVSEEPVSSKDSIWIQLYDQALVPLSERITINTFEDCERNLILLNFRQVR